MKGFKLTSANFTSNVFFLACVVLEPIYGHFMGYIGTGLFSLHVSINLYNANLGGKEYRENKPVPIKPI